MGQTAAQRSGPAQISNDHNDGTTTIYPLRLNGRPLSVNVDSNSLLLYVLRDDMGLPGPKYGCGLGHAVPTHAGGYGGRPGRPRLVCGLTFGAYYPPSYKALADIAAVAVWRL